MLKPRGRQVGFRIRPIGKDSKMCHCCKKTKLLSEYNNGTAKQYNGQLCRSCMKDYRSKPENKKKENERKNGYHRRLRSVVIGNYGGECACCGCDEDVFLQIDHINNDGAKERKEKGLTSRKLLNYIINNNFPNTYQILCANCHQAKSKLGKCIHRCSVEDLLKYDYVR